MLRVDQMAEEAFDRYLPDLQKWVGWFALVRGEHLSGVFPTYGAATLAWMSLYGPVPVLIRRIESVSGSPAALVAPPTSAATGVPRLATPPVAPDPGIEGVHRVPGPFRRMIPWAAGTGLVAPRKTYVA